MNVAAEFRAACALELEALKPGNVHRHAAGHGMTVEDFLHSADAAAEPLCRAGARLGERVLGAVAATRAAVGQNTNLGIVLLCAPLAQAAETSTVGDLRASLRAAIAASDLVDAGMVFQAIALASPGGLGNAARYDVREPARILLPQAMAEAADRDSIARQWITGFVDVFEEGIPAFEAALARWGSETWAATATFLGLLARLPDSHIARKYGAETAEGVRRDAAQARARLDASADPERLVPDLLAWDADLKRRGLNPGTSADLTVAVIFALHLRNGLRCPGFAG